MWRKSATVFVHQTFHLMCYIHSEGAQPVSSQNTKHFSLPSLGSRELISTTSSPSVSEGGRDGINIWWRGKKKKGKQKKWLGSSRMSSRKAQNVSFEIILPCLHKTWRMAWAWLWNVHKSICKDWIMIILTTGSSKIHRRASLNTAVRRRGLWNLPGSVLPEPQEQAAAEMMPFWLWGIMREKVMSESSSWYRPSSRPAAQTTCGLCERHPKWKL